MIGGSSPGRGGLPARNLATVVTELPRLFIYVAYVGEIGNAHKFLAGNPEEKRSLRRPVRK
jgi:hypothetical protein